MSVVPGPWLEVELFTAAAGCYGHEEGIDVAGTPKRILEMNGMACFWVRSRNEQGKLSYQRIPILDWEADVVVAGEGQNWPRPFNNASRRT